MDGVNHVIQHRYCKARPYADPEGVVHYHVCIGQFPVHPTGSSDKRWLPQKIASEEKSRADLSFT
jgi:GH24 family phage-related lysozyme (muramidase)